MHDRAQGIAYAGAIIVVFSGFVLVSRLGLAGTLALPDLAALRFGIGGLLLAPVLLQPGGAGIGLRQAAGLAVLGGLGFALLAYAGFTLAPAAHGSVLIHGTLPLTTALLAWLWLDGGFPRRTALSMLFIALGVLVLAWDGFSRGSALVLIGDACLLMASCCWSGYALYVRRLGLSAVRASAVVAVGSALLFLPAYAALPGKMLLQAGWREIAVQAVFQGVLVGAASVFIYTRAIALAGAAEVALFTAAVPGVTTLGAIVLLGETPGAATLLAVALVTLGIAAGLRRAG